MIKAQPGGGFRLYTSTGTRPLVRKKQTYEEALAQEAAIKAAERRRGKR